MRKHCKKINKCDVKFTAIVLLKQQNKRKVLIYRRAHLQTHTKSNQTKNKVSIHAYTISK